jgi:hypothetical protein
MQSDFPEIDGRLNGRIQIFVWIRWQSKDRMRSFLVSLKPDSRQTSKAAARAGQTNISALIGTPGRGCQAVAPPANQKGTDKANSNKKNRGGERVSAAIRYAV